VNSRTVVLAGLVVVLAVGLGWAVWATRAKAPEGGTPTRTEQVNAFRPPPGAPRTPVQAGPLTAQVAEFQLAIFHLPRPEQSSVARAAVLARGSRFEFLTSPATKPPETSVLYAHLESTKSYVVPVGEKFQYTTRNLPEDMLQKLSSSEQVTVLDFRLSPPTVGDVRKAYALAGDLAAATGGVLWDEETSELFSLAAWNEKRLTGWDNSLPPGMRHFVMHLYEGSGGNGSFVTAGLAKFGLPDVVISNVPASLQSQMAALTNVVAQVLIEQPKVVEAGTVTVDLNAIAHQRLRESLLEAKRPEAPGKVTLGLVYSGKIGERANPLVEVTFPESLGGATVEDRMRHAMEALFGKPESAAAAQPEDAGTKGTRMGRPVEKPGQAGAHK